MERRTPSIEEAQPKSKGIVTDELVGRIRKVSGVLDDVVELIDLRPLPLAAKGFLRNMQRRFPEEANEYRKRYLDEMGLVEDRNAPEGWDEFWASLSDTEKSYLSRTLHQAIDNGLFTVGDVRDAYYEGLVNHTADRPKPMGRVRAAFLKGIFEPE